MKLTENTKVHELLVEHPFLEDFLVSQSPRFEMLKNRMARATIGRVATVKTAAGIAGLDLGVLLENIAAEIERKSGKRPETGVTETTGAVGREERVRELMEIIRDLHDGGDLEQAKKRFSGAVGDVEASEIAAMEEELIRGGLPVSEVQRLCDVHVGAFRHALDGHAELSAPTGHPVDNYMAENRKIAELAGRLGELARGAGGGDGSAAMRAAEVLEGLSGIDNHYQRKENQLFPALERHGITGPSQVMWGVHDQIRAKLKKVREAARLGDLGLFASEAPGLARNLVEMIYKEEKILLPLAMRTLDDQGWAEIRRGEDVLGYALSGTPEPWPAAQPTAATATGDGAAAGTLEMMTGALSLEQVNLIFSHLPVDLSLVDENDTVRFYSEGPERIFPRSPGVIGRRVQNCHPPKSVHIVQEILDSFRAGKQSVAEFWMQSRGKFLHIRYIAVRDKEGNYRGCLEATQDATGIRSLQGERRLLSWDSTAA